MGKCLDSIISDDYPKDRLEMLVVDGMREGGPMDIIEKYVRRYPFIRLLDNPEEITRCGLDWVLSREGESTLYG